VAAVIYLDTHVVAWLYAGLTDRFPAAVRRLLEENDLLVSPMVGLELQYLYEIQRTTEPSATVIGALGAAIGLQVCELPFPQVAAEALRQAWTRDPFDRLITAQAAVRQTPLITKDETIRAHYARAVWEA
jgi:PIN domain nuclease of toxin-antitoxin system